MFSFISPVSRYLQSKSIDMKDGETRLISIYESVKEMKENFVEMKTSVEPARTWTVESYFQQNRLTLVKNHFGELRQDDITEDGEKRLKVEIYNQLLGILVSQFEECLKAFSEVTEKFNILRLILLDSAND